GLESKLTVLDLARNHHELLEMRNQETSKNFRKRLLITALETGIARKKGLYLVNKNSRAKKIKDSEYKLNYHLVSDSRLKSVKLLNDQILQTEYSEEARLKYLAESLENIVRINLIMDDIEKLENSLEAELKKNPPLMKSTGRNSMPSFLETPKRNSIRSFYQREIALRQAHLGKLKADSGALLNISSNSAWKAFLFSDYDFEISDFGELMFDLISSEEYAKIKKEVNLTEGVYNSLSPLEFPNIDKLSVSLAMALHLEDFDSIGQWLLNKTQNYSHFEQELMWGIQREIAKINNAAAGLADKGTEWEFNSNDSGEFQLHHYDSLVTKVLQSNLIAKTELSEQGETIYHENPYSKYLMIKDLGAFCYLKQKFPQQQFDPFTPANLVAMGAVGVGTILSSTGILSGPGLAFALAGSGYLAYVAGDAWLLQDTIVDAEETLSQGGWLSYEKTFDSMNSRYSSALETIMYAVGVGQVLPLAVKYGPNAVHELRFAAAKKGRNSVRDAAKASQIVNAKRNQRWLIEKNYKKYLEAIMARFRYFKSDQYQNKIKYWRDLKNWIKSGAEIDFTRVKILDFVFEGIRRATGKKPRLRFNLKKPNTLSAIHRASPNGKKAIQEVDDLIHSPTPSPATTEAIDARLEFFTGNPAPRRRISEVFDEGASANEQLPIVQNLLDEWTPEKFLKDGPLKVNLPYVDNGEVLYNINRSVFHDRFALKNLEDDLNNKINYIFANTPAKEMSRNSAIYRGLDDWAENYRLLEYQRAEILMVPHRTPLQEEYLRKIEAVLTNPKHQPRGDAELALLRREVFEQIRDLFRSKKTKEKIYGEGLENLHGITRAKVNRSNFLANHFKTILLGSTFFGSSSTLFIMRKSATLRVANAKLEFLKRDFSRTENLNFTDDEFSCAFEGRSFSFMVCYYAQAQKEFAVELAKAESLDDRFSLMNDKEWKKGLRNYAYKMISLRRRFRAAEFFNMANLILERTYSDSAKTWFANIIEEKEPEHPEMSTRILEILGSETKEDAMMLLEAFVADYGDRYLKSLQIYLNAPKEQTLNFKESTRLSRAIENDLLEFNFLVGQTGSLGEEYNTFMGGLFAELEYDINNALRFRSAEEIEKENQDLESDLEELDKKQDSKPEATDDNSEEEPNSDELTKQDSAS
ncbi:MAG: hypothetical protein VX642_06905, partial [Bdellovibrionota bacterium]|nr:hypothetical protein [Bdellovibrionota bacterium]